MDKDLGRKLDRITDLLETLVKQTAPPKQPSASDLAGRKRKGYAGVPPDDPRLRGLP